MGAEEDKKKKFTQTDTAPLRNMLGSYNLFGTPQTEQTSTPVSKFVFKPEKKIPGFDERSLKSPNSYNPDRLSTPVELVKKLGASIIPDAKPTVKYNSFGEKIVDPITKAVTKQDVVNAVIEKKGTRKPVLKPTNTPILETPKTEEESAWSKFWDKDTVNKARSAGIILGGGLSALGAGILGQSATGANQAMQKGLDDLDNEKFDDPDSDESKQAREVGTKLYKKLGVTIDPKMTANQFRQISPVYDKLYMRSLAEQKASIGNNATSKPILDTKAYDRLSQAKYLKDQTQKLGDNVSNSNWFTRMIGYDDPAEKNITAENIAATKATMMGQGQASEGQLKTARENYTAPDLLQLSSTKGANIKKEGQDFYNQELDKLVAQGFVRRQTPDGKKFLVHPQTGEYLEVD
jgi:hypothetical protein